MILAIILTIKLLKKTHRYWLAIKIWFGGEKGRCVHLINDHCAVGYFRTLIYLICTTIIILFLLLSKQKGELRRSLVSAVNYNDEYVSLLSCLPSNSKENQLFSYVFICCNVFWTGHCAMFAAGKWFIYLHQKEANCFNGWFCFWQAAVKFQVLV